MQSVYVKDSSFHAKIFHILKSNTGFYPNWVFCFEVHEGILVPKASDFEYEGHKLIIFEDLYEEICENLAMSKFFTFLSRWYVLS